MYVTLYNVFMCVFEIFKINVYSLSAFKCVYSLRFFSSVCSLRSNKHT